MASWFLLDLADRVGLELELDLYERKDFASQGPGGCNNCGGILSESLVQMLAAEGLNLPSRIVQRAIDAYVLHTDAGRATIRTPLHEMRIATVHRGAGPRGVESPRWDSFDSHLVDLARGKGARLLTGRVDELSRGPGGRPLVRVEGEPERSYDLVVGAVGVNSASLKLFEGLGLRYRPPVSTKTFICEYHLGEEEVTRQLGSAMHLFLLNVPRLKFAAFIPKGETVTLCLLGERIDNALVDRFLGSRAVSGSFGWSGDKLARACRCGPRMQVRSAMHPFGDRVVLVGDVGVSRLYKDGIGAAYRSAKAMALSAVFDGVAEEAFARRYWRTCRSIRADNACGRLLFAAAGLFRFLPWLQRGMLRQVEREQALERGSRRRMSGVLWDTFTGSAPYRDILVRAMHPALLAALGANTGAALLPGGGAGREAGA
jgi:2-polyprenyl-6-methoxyphenol hydroxylase-like FAD-dependent oxidoreductase